MLIDIAYTVNEKYAKYLYVSMISLLESNEGEDMRFHILSNDLCQSSKEIMNELAEKHSSSCIFYEVTDIDQFSDYVSNGYSIEVYFRMFLPWKLCDITKVLFLDADTIIKGRIASFFETNLDDKAFAACIDSAKSHSLLKARNDIFCRKNDFRYYNAGVMLWNMANIREAITIDSIKEVINRFGNRLYFNDQDILNYLFYENAIQIDEKFNYLVGCHSNDEDFDKKVKDAVIIHYAGENPWKIGKKDRIDFEIWWGFAEKTPFYQEIVEETLYNTAGRISQIELQTNVYKAYSEFKLQKKKIEDVDLIKNYSSIALYGAGAWARLLLDELGDKRNKIKYIFDKKEIGMIYGIEIISNETIGIVKDIDVMIITPFNQYENIKKELSAKTEVPLYSIIDVFS